MAYFSQDVETCQERHLGKCPSCGTRLRFANAILCYPWPGRYLPRFPEPLDCAGADIRCLECESLTACRCNPALAPNTFVQRIIGKMPWSGQTL